VPDHIPYLTAMYDMPKFHEFVKLFVYYYNDNWNLAQRKWSKILGDEYTNYQGLLESERVVTTVVARETIVFAAHFHEGRRYRPWWKRWLGK
jgi:hypothetical protein